MRRYETFVIIDPDISEEQHAPVVERITDIITQGNGFLVMVDDWGARKLAYEIKKKTRGYYIRVDFCGTGSIVNEMERFFRIDDRVIKYMSVVLDKEADVEKIKEEIAKAEAEKKELEAQKAETAEEPVALEADIVEEPVAPETDIVEEPEATETDIVEEPVATKTDIVEEPEATETDTVEEAETSGTKTDADAPSSETVEPETKTDIEAEAAEPETAETESKKEE